MNKNTNRLGLKCEILISDFNEWKCRSDYIRLLENFLNNKIKFEEFDREFLNIWSTNNNKDNSWQEFIFIINNFKLNEFEGFSALTSEIMTDLDIVETNSFLEDYQITEKEFKNRIKIILLEMKNKYSKFES